MPVRPKRHPHASEDAKTTETTRWRRRQLPESQFSDMVLRENKGNNSQARRPIFGTSVLFHSRGYYSTGVPLGCQASFVVFWLIILLC
jgi:hypothetical protein